MMQEISLETNPLDRSDASDDEGLDPPTERWAPLGAPSETNRSPTTSEKKFDKNSVDYERLQQLEDDQEQLNSSLLALTTHFAQVQFRLQQICKSSSDDKEQLLKELEEFAFRGCPDLSGVKETRSWQSSVPNETTPEHEAIMQQQRTKQLQLIGQLKDQLEDMERFAYEAGDSGPPSSEVMAKQQVVLDRLRERMNLDLNQFDRLTPEDLQRHVDEALRRLTNPIKVKDQLMAQLRTQITDLERFIEFLQGCGNAPITCTCTPAGSGDSKSSMCRIHGPGASGSIKSFEYTQTSKPPDTGVFKQTATFLELYVLALMGCQSRKFQKNQLKTTLKGNHWGDLRAALELAIKATVEVMEQHQNEENPATINLQSVDEEEEAEDVFRACPEEVVSVVRKQLCSALRGLLQHGLLSQSGASHGMIVPFGCFPTRSRKATVEEQLHPWDIIVKYYEMKHGKEFSEAPVRKLSQSFNLDSIGGKAITSKQMLLSTIDNIMLTHTKLKRSPDAMFKAFVCAALNHKKLVAWLRMILRTREIVDECYAPWSYVTRTGCDDACGALEKLNQFSFCLPFDLAVRQFHNIKDAF